MKRKTILLTLCVVVSLSFAQVDTFNVEAAWNIDLEARSFHLRAHDFDDNGIIELYFVRNLAGQTYQIGIIENGAISTLSSIQRNDYGYSIFAYDFNGNGHDDILFQNINQRQAQLFSGPNLNLVWTHREFFGPQFIDNGAIGTGENDEQAALLLQDAHHSWHVSSGEFRHDSYHWYCGNLLLVNNVNTPLDSLCAVPWFGSYETIWNGQRTDFFIAGHATLFGMVMGKGDFDSTYFYLSTSYQAEWARPDTFELFRGRTYYDRDGHGMYRVHAARNAFVGHCTDDWDIDWVVPMWDENGLETYAIFVYRIDAASLDTVAVYRETLPGMGDYPMDTHFCKGACGVDINDDGIAEILLAIRNNRLRILDGETMELLMVSDIVIPHVSGYLMEVGRFQDDVDNLQLALNTADGVVVYNLPEEWGEPVMGVDNGGNGIPPYGFGVSAYPNPFNSTTTIEYRVRANSNSTTLSLYDLSGRLVQTLVNERLTPGNYRTTLNANNLASGVYVVRMEADPSQPTLEREVYSRKVVVVK